MIVKGVCSTHTIGPPNGSVPDMDERRPSGEMMKRLSACFFLQLIHKIQVEFPHMIRYTKYVLSFRIYRQRVIFMRVNYGHQGN